MTSTRRFATIAIGATMIAQLFAPTFAFAIEEGVPVDMSKLREMLNTTGLVGLVLQAYDVRSLMSDEKKALATKLLEELRTYKNQLRQKQLDEFGDYVDLHGLDIASVIESAFQSLATKGKITNVTAEADAKNVVASIDLGALAALIKDGPARTQYGQLFATAANKELAIFAPDATDVSLLLPNNTRIEKRSFDERGIALFPFTVLDELIANNGGSIAIQYKLDDKAPTYVVPATVSPLERIAGKTMDEIFEDLTRLKTVGIGSAIDFLVANGRTCIALDAPAAIASVSEMGFLAQTSQLLARWWNVLWGAVKNLFVPRTEAAGNARAFYCAGVDAQGKVAAELFKMVRSDGEFSDSSVVRVGENDLLTRRVNPSTLIAEVPKGFPQNAGKNGLSVVAYSPLKIVLSGTDFNNGVIQINGEPVLTELLADGSLAVTVADALRKKYPKNLWQLTVKSGTSGKVSAVMERRVSRTDKPLPAAFKEIIVASAQSVGAPIAGAPPQDLSEAYEYYLNLLRLFTEALAGAK